MKTEYLILIGAAAVVGYLVWKKCGTSTTTGTATLTPSGGVNVQLTATQQNVINQAAYASLAANCPSGFVPYKNPATGFYETCKSPTGESVIVG